MIPKQSAHYHELRFLMVMFTFTCEVDQLDPSQLVGIELCARRVAWIEHVYEKAQRSGNKSDWNFSEHFLLCPSLQEGSATSDPSRRKFIANRLKDVALVDKEMRKANEDLPAPKWKAKAGAPSPATDGGEAAAPKGKGASKKK